MRNLTSRLTRALTRLSRDDRGAIGVIVAALLGGGVLLGMGALVIDVGELYNEHADLLGSADAAAVAIAKTCITSTCDPLISVSYAQSAVTAAGHGSISIGLICGTGILGSCPDGPAGQVSCPAGTSGTGYVDVYASTPATGSSALLPSVFARTLPGIHESNSTIGVCVQASWGAPAAAQATSFTISQCAWQTATGWNPAAAPGPGGTLPPGTELPGTAPPPSGDTAFHLLNIRHRSSGCAGSQPLFGWTADQTGSCSQQVTGSYLAWAGIPLPSCLSALATAQASRIPIVIPIYSSASHAVFGTESYQLYGFADFVVTGYNLAGVSAADWLNPADSCSGSVSCIDGYFTQGIVPSTGMFSGPYLGATMIDLTH